MREVVAVPKVMEVMDSFVVRGQKLRAVAELEAQLALDAGECSEGGVTALGLPAQAEQGCGASTPRCTPGKLDKAAWGAAKLYLQAAASAALTFTLYHGASKTSAALQHALQARPARAKMVSRSS